MSKPKSIFIVDMPESFNGEVPCKHCQMHVAEYDDYYHHYVCQSIRTNISADEWEIYKNCPLKPYKDFIPIEWIKKYYEDITAPYTDTRIQFEEMIRKWEKENEANRCR